MCSLSAGRRRSQNGQRYVAGLRFWAGRTFHHRGWAAPGIAHRIAPPLPASIIGGAATPGGQWPGMVAGMELRDERIVVETDRYRITGMLSMPRDGYRSRLTDYLNADGRAFLALTDVTMAPIGSDAPITRSPFLAVAVNHIVIAMPAEPAAEPV